MRFFEPLYLYIYIFIYIYIHIYIYNKECGSLNRYTYIYYIHSIYKKEPNLKRLGLQ